MRVIIICPLIVIPINRNEIYNYRLNYNIYL